MAELNVPTVRRFMDRLRDERRSPAMIRKVTVSLGSLIADAQEQGHAARNAVRDLHRGKRRGKSARAEWKQRGKLKVGVDIPMPAEVTAILANAKSRWRPLLLTAAFTGLRASELRGLRWRDVELKNFRLHVRQRADRYNEIGATKSEAGERTVPFGKVAANTLKEWRLACPKGDGDLVFPNGSGNVESLANIINRGLVPAQLAGGITVPKLDAEGKPIVDDDGNAVMLPKYTGMHALRHFYASWCINRRADGGLELPGKVVQDRLGHATINMTMDRYGHLFPNGDDGAELSAAEGALLGAATKGG
jgi:integrase